MATVASLLVNLGMNVAGFSTGSKSAIKDLSAVSTAVTGLNSAFSLAQGGLGLMRQAFASFREVGESVRNIGELSNITGISTQRMVALQSAGKRFGVDVETLNTGLKKMTVNLGKAQEEGSPAAEAFEKLGLNAGLLNKLGGDAAFNSIANAVSRLPSPAEKAAAAVEIFGRSGADLVNVLNQGKEGLDAIQKSAEAAGLTFSKADAEQLTNNLRAMDAIGKELNGTWRQIAITVGPTLSLLAGEASSALKDAAGFISDLSKGNVGKALVDFANKSLYHASGLGLADVAEKNQRRQQDEIYGKAAEKKRIFAEMFDEGTAAAKTNAKEVSSTEQIYKALNKEQENRNRLFEVALSPLEQYRKKVEEIQTAMAKLYRQRAGNFIGEGEFNDQKSKLNQALGRVNADEYQRRNHDQLESAKRLKDSLTTPVQAQAKSLAEIASAVSLGQLTPQQATLARLQAKKTFLEAQPDTSDNGPLRSAALERGSSAAYSASFGAKPVDKNIADIARTNKLILDEQKKIDAKFGGVYPIGA